MAASWELRVLGLFAFCLLCFLTIPILRMQAEGLRWEFGCKGAQSVGLLRRKEPHKLTQLYPGPWLVKIKANAVFVFNRRCMVRLVFLKANCANGLVGLVGVAGAIRGQKWASVRKKVYAFQRYLKLFLG